MISKLYMQKQLHNLYMCASDSNIKPFHRYWETGQTYQKGGASRYDLSLREKTSALSDPTYI